MMRSVLLFFLTAYLVDVLVCDSSGGRGQHDLNILHTPKLVQRIIDNDLGGAYDLIAMGENPNVPEEPSGWTPLIYAANSGNFELAETLILAGSDVNAGCVDGWTPLMFASVHGKVDVMQLLIRNGANIHMVSKNGATALGCAKLGGFKAAVDLVETALHSDRLNEIFCDQDGREAVILSASHASDALLLETLLLDGHSPNTVSAGGWTPLMLAAAAGCMKCTQLLLDAGAFVDFRDHDGWTALMFCAHAGSVEGVRILTACHADVLLANNDGFNSLQLARAEGHDEVFHTLVDGSFCREMALGRVSRMMEMIEDGVGVNYVCASVGSYTPLIVAVKAQDENAVRVLLSDKTLDVDAVEHDHWSALMFASLRQSMPIIELLLRHGANRELLTSQGYSVIHLARLYNHDNDVVMGMLENGLHFTDSPTVYSADKTYTKKISDRNVNVQDIESANVIQEGHRTQESKSWVALWRDFRQKSTSKDKPSVQHFRPSPSESSADESDGGLRGWMGKIFGFR